MAVSPVPAGYHTATAYLIVNDCAKAIDFYKEAFGAEELMRLNGPDGKVVHAEIKVGDSPIMLSDEMPDWGVKGPHSYGGSPVHLMLYVESADSMTERAVAAGAKVTRPIENHFYGDRAGQIEDPFGHKWTLSTHIEDVPPDEMQRRTEEFMKQMAG